MPYRTFSNQLVILRLLIFIILPAKWFFFRTYNRDLISKWSFSVVDKNCVSVKLVRDQQNVKKELYYKKFNFNNEEDFDDKLDFDDIEAGK